VYRRWWLVAGGWLLVVGRWSLVVVAGRWSLGNENRGPAPSHRSVPHLEVLHVPQPLANVARSDTPATSRVRCAPCQREGHYGAPFTRVRSRIRARAHASSRAGRLTYAASCGRRTAARVAAPKRQVTATAHAWPHSSGR